MQAPAGKHIFGTVKIGDKGQIIIPKAARDIFGLKPGDQLILLGDEAQGLALVKTDMAKLFDTILASVVIEEEPEAQGTTAKASEEGRA